MLKRFVTAVFLAGLVLAPLGCGKKKSAPVIVIGLDGAEFSLLVPWMEEGHLPNLKQFMDEGAFGELTTVYPILSPVCWTSAVTGVNPGKHGIYDFQRSGKDGAPALVEQATSRRALPIWLLLDDYGYRSGVMNVPMSYPPDPLRKGKMISGFPFPQADINITYPPSLEDEIGDYPLDFLGESLFKRTPEEMLRDFYKGLEARAKVAEEWIGSGDLDFGWFVFTAPDKVQHFFWKFMDPSHPNHDPSSSSELKTAIFDLWKEQDRVLGRILAAAPPDARIIIMSDHGFEGIYRQVNMMNWLADTEFPEWLANHATPPMMVTNGVLHYHLEGLVPGSADGEALKDEFVRLAEGLRDPETGDAPFEKVFRKEDIYSGRTLEKAPDIVFYENPYYYVTSGVSPDSLDLAWIENLWSTSFSAYHRPEGIVAMRGPGIEPSTSGTLRERLQAGGDFKKANIMDITPTILALVGEMLPDQLDGRVLEEVLTEQQLLDYPVVIGEVPGFLLDRPVREPTEEERESMKAIPYLDGE